MRQGDRVRAGSKRGGYVIEMLERGRAQLFALFPDGSRAWLEHCEPDEDGDALTADSCRACGALHRSADVLCINCAEELGPPPAWVKEWASNYIAARLARRKRSE